MYMSCTPKDQDCLEGVAADVSERAYCSTSLYLPLVYREVSTYFRAVRYPSTATRHQCPRRSKLSNGATTNVGGASTAAAPRDVLESSRMEGTIYHVGSVVSYIPSETLMRAAFYQLRQLTAFHFTTVAVGLWRSGSCVSFEL